MRKILLVFLIMQVSITYVFAQNCSDDIFEIEVYNSSKDNFKIVYWDKNIDKFKSPPKFASTVPLDRLVKFRFSAQKRDSIEKQLFAAEKLDTLKRGIVIVGIHIPSGEIVSTSFSLRNDVDLKKIKELKIELEKNLRFEVMLGAELEQEGYLVQSFPIFVSRRKR